MAEPRHAVAEEPQKPWLSNRTYDALKWVAMVLLPAIGALYFGLAQIWGLPSAEEVIGTVTVVDTFLGVILGLSTKQYNNSGAKYDGDVDVVENEEGKKSFLLNLYSDPQNLDQQNEIVFKVNSSS